MDVKELVEKLSKYPDLKQQVEEMLGIVENSNQEILLADVAEERVISAVRDMGRSLMQNWASQRSSQASLQMKQQVQSAKKNIKKKSTGKPALEK